jgi:hypothetical protein
MNEIPGAAPNVKSGWRSILLGAFVLFQLIYLPLSNLVQLAPRELPIESGERDIRVQREGTASSIRPIQEAINGIGTAIDRYGEFTGQVQAWSLFAPGFGQQAVFPIVECFFLDGQRLVKIKLRPTIEPADADDYFRWPGSYSRIAGYEFLLAAIYLNFSEESLAKRGAEWSEAVRDHVRQHQKSLEAYFRWNLRKVRRRYPDLPVPQEMVVQVHIVPSPKPGESTRPPTLTLPLARWIPSRQPERSFLPIDAYDPVANEFIRLPVEEARR